MTPQQVEQLIGTIGVAVQFGGALLLSLLFYLLRRHSARRAYFAIWGRAWLVMVIALAAVLLGALAPQVEGRGAPGYEARMRVLSFTYQLCKLLFVSLLVIGTRVYAFGVQPRRAYRWAAGLAVAYSIATVLVSRVLGGAVALQAPLVVGAFAYCALTLLTVPASRRSLGSSVTGIFFLLTALVWSLYFLAFSNWWQGDAHWIAGPLRLVALANPYLDLLLQMLLGYGMVVMLMEDGKREADDAHAELAVAHDKLRRDALYDSLTGSLNRRAFAEGVGLEMAKATFGAVVVLDMDNLKTVNDSAGHAAGDELLQHLATTLRAVIRPSDRLYRWGGDEFLLVFPGARSADVHRRVELAIAGAAPMTQLHRESVPLVASVGAADYSSGEELLHAIERADGVMYREKKARRSREKAPRDNTPAMAHRPFVKIE